MNKIISAIFAWAALSALVLQAQPLTNGVALAYFAPENQLFYRMRYEDGGYREFQKDIDEPDRMQGVLGWKARHVGAGNVVVTGRGEQGPERYLFKMGRLIASEVAGVTNSFDYAEVRLASEDEVPPYMYGSKTDASVHTRKKARKPMSVDKLLGNKWKKSGRLAWPFKNPNENGFFYASFVLLALYLTVFRRRSLRIAGVVLAFSFFVPLVMTASRGSLLALCVGLVPMGLVRFKTLLHSRWTYLALALVVGFAVVWFSTHNSRILTRGFKGKSAWSNEVRMEMWRMAPVMMVDAPDGWRANAGKAYLDWYEDLEQFSAAGSLINDHYSRMVRMGWTKRFLYIAGWLALLLGLFAWALRTKNAVPVGLFSAYAVGAWFNPLMINGWLWTAPLLSLVPVLLDRPWRDWRRWAVAAGVALPVAAALTALLFYLGGHTPHPMGVSVSVEGPRVMVQGSSPDIWVVDDGLTLGGAFACKDVRGWYARVPQSPAVGYVRDVDWLPERRFRRLVLGGESGDAWLHLVSTNAAVRSRLPQEVVFISPPFPPSAIPPPLFDCARVKYVTGEFNARYSREFDEPPPFVEIVPAMELYIYDWMRFAVNE